MKHKKLIIILILIILLIVGAIVYFSTSKSNVNMQKNFEQMRGQFKEGKEQQTKKTSTLKSTSEIESSLVEKIEPHASYYLKEVYISEKQYVSKGENILKYTNGKYLVAPYDCCITELELPDEGEKILNSHYIQIESTNILTVSMSIDEEKIDNIELGSEAEIQVTAVDGTYTGYVTHIASTANNGKFTIDIEFENDSKVKIGMTASVVLTYTESTK